MIEVKKTGEFDTWLADLRDVKARAKIITRIQRLELGNPGDAKAIGGGISEMRIDYGAGYRVYYTQTGKAIVLLLCGGDKSSQAQDIKRARQLSAEL